MNAWSFYGKAEELAEKYRELSSERSEESVFRQNSRKKQIPFLGQAPPPGMPNWRLFPHPVKPCWRTDLFSDRRFYEAKILNFELSTVNS